MNLVKVDGNKHGRPDKRDVSLNCVDCQATTDQESQSLPPLAPAANAGI